MRRLLPLILAVAGLILACFLASPRPDSFGLDRLGPAAFLPEQGGVAPFPAPDVVGFEDLAELSAPAEPLAAEPLPPSRAGVLVVDFVDGTSLATVESLGREINVALVWSSAVSEDESLARGRAEDLPAALERLKGNPLVEVAEPAVEMKAFGWIPTDLLPADYPNDPAWSRQWNLQRIGAAAGWKAGGGRGVRVAVLDTGILAVPDLDGVKLEVGRSFVPGVPTAQDDVGHGTHVAGTIAQATNNGLGVAGIAPQVTLIPYKVLSKQGVGQSDWIAAAVDEAVDQGADIINLSLGGAHSEVLHRAVEQAVAAGVIVVAAAGNTGREGVGCPAHARGVIGVSALGTDGRVMSYSSWGEGIDLAAPGGDTRLVNGGVLQDTLEEKEGHGLLSWQGTSMAAPHVTGSAAVLLGAGVGGPEEVTELLFRSADREGTSRHDPQYGHGRLDLGAALLRDMMLHKGVLFLLAGLMGLGLLRAGQAPLWKQLLTGLLSGLIAGGLFFLPLLPLRPSLALELASRPLLALPGLWDSDWSSMPVWASALLPLIVMVLLGSVRALQPLTVGLAAGVGVPLCLAAFTGSIDPWFLGASGDRWWLLGNGLICLLGAMAVVGLHLARAREAQKAAGSSPLRS